MVGYFRGVAVDLDGTLASNGPPGADVLAALDDLRATGIACLLVTGRIVAELTADFPGLLDHFDACVAENGAMLVAGAETRCLAEPVDPQLHAALGQLAVPSRRGQALLACDGGDTATVASEVARLGLDCQLMHNRGALMVLPAGVSKGTGLLAALEDLDVSVHNVIAIGDAENDLALLSVAEVGAAVGNAVASLRAHADLVLDEPDGAAVIKLLRGPLMAGTDVFRPGRRELVIGRYEDGTPATVPGAQANVLICGDTGAGKSHCAGLLVEQWIRSGYTVLVVDLEGDHVALGHLHNTIVVDERDLPAGPELMQILRQRAVSVVLDLSGLPHESMLAYLVELSSIIEAERAVCGVPHWIVVDEAHIPLVEQGAAAEAIRPADHGYCLITYQPASLCADVLASIDLVITALHPPVPSPRGHNAPATALLRQRGGLDRPMTLISRRTPHVRHRHKYAAAPLPPHRRFQFRTLDGRICGEAANLGQFQDALHDLPGAVVEHHLLHGDFSRWFTGTLGDRDLGNMAAAVERGFIGRRATEVDHARRRLLDEIEGRYLTP